MSGRTLALLALLSPAAVAADPPSFAARCTDDSVIYLQVLDEVLVLETPHGRLTIPVGQVLRVEFASRVSDDAQRRVDAAIADLGSNQFKTREAATVALRKLREKAYPALQLAAKSDDAEVRRRATDLVDRLREAVGESKLELRPHDIVHTEHSRVAGRLTANALRVRTEAFGDQALRLHDVVSLRAPGVKDPEPEPVNVLPGPRNLGEHEREVGKTLAFRVTGEAAGSLWGTDVYTTDSSLAVAAVHAGLLKVGQTGVVKVSILASPPNFAGSVRNGVTSDAYPQPYRAAFQFVR